VRVVVRVVLQQDRAVHHISCSTCQSRLSCHTGRSRPSPRTCLSKHSDVSPHNNCARISSRTNSVAGAVQSLTKHQSPTPPVHFQGLKLSLESAGPFSSRSVHNRIRSISLSLIAMLHQCRPVYLGDVSFRTRPQPRAGSAIFFREGVTSSAIRCWMLCGIEVLEIEAGGG